MSGLWQIRRRNCRIGTLSIKTFVFVRKSESWGGGSLIFSYIYPINEGAKSHPATSLTNQRSKESNETENSDDVLNILIGYVTILPPYEAMVFFAHDSLKYGQFSEGHRVIRIRRFQKRIYMTCKEIT